MAKKAKAPNPFTGRWRIVSMSASAQDFVDEEEEGAEDSDRSRTSLEVVVRSLIHAETFLLRR